MSALSTAGAIDVVTLNGTNLTIVGLGLSATANGSGRGGNASNTAPINTLLEASVDPDVVANGYIAEVDYPEYGKRLKVHGSPWQFSETPAKIGIAPGLGEHNEEVLGSLGYDATQIVDLKNRKVI